MAEAFLGAGTMLDEEGGLLPAAGAAEDQGTAVAVCVERVAVGEAGNPEGPAEGPVSWRLCGLSGASTLVGGRRTLRWGVFLCLCVRVWGLRVDVSKGGESSFLLLRRPPFSVCAAGDAWRVMLAGRTLGSLRGLECWCGGPPYGPRC